MQTLLTVYDPKTGEPENGIAAGTSFESLPGSYSCSLCEGPKDDFVKRRKRRIGLTTHLIPHGH